MMLTVKLARTIRFSPARSIVLTQLTDARHHIPFDKRPRPKQTVVNRAQQKEIQHDAMDGREASKMGG